MNLNEWNLIGLNVTKVNRNLSHQISPKMNWNWIELNSIGVNWIEIDVFQVQKSSTPFIDDLLDELFGRKSVDSGWPYLCSDAEWDCGFSPPEAPPEASPEALQPKTDVRVSFSSLNQRCHSLLVELKVILPASGIFFFRKSSI